MAMALASFTDISPLSTRSTCVVSVPKNAAMSETRTLTWGGLIIRMISHFIILSFSRFSFLVFDDLAESRRKFTKCQRHKINKNKCYNYCIDINSRSHKPCTNILICAYPSQTKISRFGHTPHPLGGTIDFRGEKGG